MIIQQVVVPSVGDGVLLHADEDGLDLLDAGIRGDELFFCDELRAEERDCQEGHGGGDL